MGQGGLLVLPEHGCGIDNRANSDMLFVDFREIVHTVLRPASPRQLRGGVGTAAPIIGVADHRYGVRWTAGEKTARANARAAARAVGPAEVLRVRAQQHKAMKKKSCAGGGRRHAAGD